MDLSKETGFAQQLAGNEQKQRNKALKRLKSYLQAKSASKKNPYCHEDFLKIWKGLHYCMWMQDKPLVQEELSTKITQLVHDIATVDQRCLFIRVFIETEAREWNTLDIWRVDKFMMLFRSMLTESLVMLKNLNWKKKHVDELLNIYREILLNVNEDQAPQGLRSHFVEIYVDEVHRVGGSKINTKQFLMLLDPFVRFIQMVKDEGVAMKVAKKIFDPLIERTNKLALNKGKTKDEESEDIIYPDLQLDTKVIIDYLFDIGKSEEISAKKRELFYSLVKRFQDAGDGLVPKLPELPKGPAITNQMVGEAMITLKQLHMEKSEKLTRKELKKLEKKRKSLLKGDGKENTTENDEPGVNVSTADAEPRVIVGKKRKHSETDTNDEPVNKVKKKGKNKEDLRSSSKVTNDRENETTSNTKGKKGKKNKIWKSRKESLEKKSKVITNGEDISTNKQNGQVVSESGTENETAKDISLSSKKVEPMEESTDNKQKQEKELEGNSKSAKKRKIDQTDGMSSSKVCETSKCDKKYSQTLTEDFNNAIDKTAAESEPDKNEQSVIQIKPSDDLEEGEVEIFVPSKKYKGRISMSPAKFADFESTKTPVAFVKRALSKASKGSSSTPGYIKRKTETPGSNTALTGSAKKVSFNMRKNQAQSFKDSLKSPIVPFNPAKTPDQSILKTPTRNTPNPNSGRKNSRTGSINTPPSSGSLKTLKTPKRVMALKHVRMASPKMSLQAKVSRKVASDFFAL